MERSQRERLTEELTLVLLYLTSFTEKQCPNVRMAWKTHDWTALDDLAEDGFMVPPHNRKNYTRYLTDEGVEKAKELLEQIGPSLGFKKKIGEIDVLLSANSRSSTTAVATEMASSFYEQKS